MSDRLRIEKTYKLYIGGQFPRTESGRSTKVVGVGGGVAAHVCHASRKDLRNAVEAARKALGGWSGSDAFLRSQILYRIAEMMEGKRGELEEALSVVGGGDGGSGLSARDEVDASIDRMVHFAGWCDKVHHVLGGANAVPGPYHNFTVPGPTGVVVVFAPDEPALLGLVSLLGPVLSGGNTAVVVSGGVNPIVSAVFAEACATGDVPGGVVNVLTAPRDELIDHAASHRDVDGIHAAGLSGDQRRRAELGAAENLKRVAVREVSGVSAWLDGAVCEGPWWIESFVEAKTIWHPSAT